MRKDAAVSQAVSAFAQNLRSSRASLGLTQEGLAEVSGLSTNHVARMEVGLSTPSFATLARLAAVLNVSPSDLLAGEFRPPAPSELGATVAELLDPLDDAELDYVLTQLRALVRFILSHRKAGERLYGSAGANGVSPSATAPPA